MIEPLVVHRDAIEAFEAQTGFIGIAQKKIAAGKWKLADGEKEVETSE